MEFFWTYDLDIEKVKEMTSLYKLIEGMTILNSTLKRRILEEKLSIMMSEDTFELIEDALQRNCGTRFKRHTAQTRQTFEHTRSNYRLSRKVLYEIYAIGGINGTNIFNTGTRNQPKETEQNDRHTRNARFRQNLYDW